jgi:OmpA-OmpF porin, OOP family
MLSRNVLLAAAMVALPLAAQAQPVSGLYIGGGAGVNYLQPVGASSSGAFSGSGQFQSHVGPALVLSLGWGFGNGFRAEVEGNYMSNQFYSASGFGGAIVGSGGEWQKFGGMVNGFYDFTNVSPWVVPFVGVGVGYEGSKLTSGVAFGPQFSNTILYIGNQTVGSFAYQAMLGVAFPIPSAPGLAITTEYRFMGLAGDRDIPYVKAAGGTGGGVGTVKLDDYNHAVLIGLRYSFGAPTPPPPPAPPATVPAAAAVPARSYLVFFDWDKATLSVRAQQIIKEAAENSTHVQYTRIEVNGYTDTSGTPQYNQGLSVRRAQAVAGELVRDGVPQAAIGIRGFGETHLLVPTGAGVREPQNRRVEIIIR